MVQHGVSTTEVRWQKISVTYQRELRPLLHNWAAWFFALLWLVSLCYVLFRGKATSFIGTCLFSIFILTLTVLTVFLTPSAAPEPTKIISSLRYRLWIQLSFLLLCVLLFTYYGLIVNGVPLFLSHDQVQQFDYLLKYNVYYIGNVLLYFLLPMIVLWLLKVRWSEVGFGRGQKTWTVVLIWGSVLLTAIVVLMFVERVGVFPGILKNFVSTLFAAGFSEEFLFRGALLTRLRGLLGTSWAIIISSLLFGLAHVGTNLYGDAGGEYLAAFAFGVFSQALLGLCFAIIFVRTRNLIAPAIVHTLLDMFSSLI